MKNPIVIGLDGYKTTPVHHGTWLETPGYAYSILLTSSNTGARISVRVLDGQLPQISLIKGDGRKRRGFECFARHECSLDKKAMQEIAKDLLKSAREKNLIPERAA